MPMSTLPSLFIYHIYGSDSSNTSRPKAEPLHNFLINRKVAQSSMREYKMAITNNCIRERVLM